jgi:hypothetical protein
MTIATIDKQNFATSIGQIYTSIQSHPSEKFFVLPASVIPIDDDYDIKEYLQDIITRYQIEHDDEFKSLALQADTILWK